jgi:hypothetical protein
VIFPTQRARTHTGCKQASKQATSLLACYTGCTVHDKSSGALQPYLNFQKG